MKTVPTCRNEKNTMRLTGHTRIIFKEMCRRVGADISAVEKGFVSSPEHDSKWYTRYSWSEEEEMNFVEWLADYLYNSGEARREITNSGLRNKRHLRRVANEFVFIWGWRYKDKEGG